jgi:hypothetical protein
MVIGNILALIAFLVAAYAQMEVISYSHYPTAYPDNREGNEKLRHYTALRAGAIGVFIAVIVFQIGIRLGAG